MPPSLLIDVDQIDLNRVIYDVDAIEDVNPHRHEMRQLDGIVHIDIEAGTAMGYRDVTDQEFWVRGHIPGRPLMPGVIMVEAAAQLASFCAKKIRKEEKRFIGFGGIEDVKFRVSVTPGDRLWLLGKFLERKPRRFKFAAQGLVDNKIAFQAIIIGMPI